MESAFWWRVEGRGLHVEGEGNMSRVQKNKNNRSITKQKILKHKRYILSRKYDKNINKKYKYKYKYKLNKKCE